MTSFFERLGGAAPSASYLAESKPSSDAAPKPWASADRLRGILEKDRDIRVSLQELDRFGMALKLSHTRPEGSKEDLIQRMLDARLMSKLHASDIETLTMRALTEHLTVTGENQKVDIQMIYEAQIRACQAFNSTFPGKSAGRGH